MYVVMFVCVRARVSMYMKERERVLKTVCAYVRVRVLACSVVERRLGGENSRAERYRESELSVGS